MLRWVIFSVVVVALAGMSTVAYTLLSASSSVPSEPVLTGQDVPTGPPGSAQVNAPLLHDFGIMAQHTDGKHEWTITNTGKGDLKLAKGQSTCSCTIANLQNGTEEALAPGKSTTVLLDWNTKANNGKWSQSATILVKNDPEHQKLDFVISGTVRPAVITFPTDGAVDFGAVENDTKHDRQVAIFSIDRPETQYKVERISNPALFDIVIQPADATDLTNLRDALARMQGSKEPPHNEKDPNHKDHGPSDSTLKKAFKILITLKPAAAIGAFQEEIMISTDHPSKPRVNLTVIGKVKGPITLTPERVRILDVSSKRGESQNLTIWVRGQKVTSFDVVRKPKGVDVQVTPVPDSANTAASRYQLSVKIPAGIASGSITDDIVLKTDHPRAGEVKIPVSIFVRAN